MRVYVESNFLLELAFTQEQHDGAETILHWAEAGHIALLLPGNCIAEPLSTLALRHRRRTQLAGEMARQVTDLARSSALAAEAVLLTPVPERLSSINDRELALIDSIMSRVLAAAHVIPITASIFTDSRRLRRAYDLPPQDALIVAAILAHSQSAAERIDSFFVSRNWRDFDDAGIIAELARTLCTYHRSYDDAAELLASLPGIANTSSPTPPANPPPP